MSLITSLALCELLSSIAVYVVIFTLGYLYDHLVSDRISSRNRQLAVDFKVTFQFVSCTIEAINVRVVFGNYAFVLTLFLIGCWLSFYKDDVGSCNPTELVVFFVMRQLALERLFVRVLAQLAAGWCAYRFVHDILWMGELSYIHALKHKAMCGNDLSVTPVEGVLIEFIACFVVTLMSLITMTSHSTAETAAKCLIEAYITRLGVDYTGLYINPVNASSQTFRCAGSDPLEHVIVYWAAPIVATVCAHQLHKNFRGAKPKRM